MNELQIIKAQLALERQHVHEVSRACAFAMTKLAERGPTQALAGFREACVDYLVKTLAAFEVREQGYRELLARRFGADDPSRQAAEAALASEGTIRDTLAKLAAAVAKGATSQTWQDYLGYLEGPWSHRRDQLDALFSKQAKITDWRSVWAIDADSIYEERARYARVQATLPPGVDLTATAPHG